MGRTLLLAVGAPCILERASESNQPIGLECAGGGGGLVGVIQERFVLSLNCA